MALEGAKSQLQQERTYGGVASSRIRPLTRLVGKFSKSKVSPKKKNSPDPAGLNDLLSESLSMPQCEVAFYTTCTHHFSTCIHLKS